MVVDTGSCNMVAAVCCHRASPNGTRRSTVFKLTKDNKLRRAAIILMRSVGFDRFILLVILANMIVMTMQSNQPGFNNTKL